jgi:sugar phosphate permease
MLLGVSIWGLGLVCVSQASNLTVFYIGFVILGIGTSLAFTMVPQTMIARWFKRDIGKASAVLAMGVGIGGTLVPVLVRMIDSYSWQTSLLILAIGMWVLGTPLSFVFRTRPEEYGLLPDGKLPDDAKDSSSSESYHLNIGVKKALKMRAFWHIGIASMLQWGAVCALMTHVMPYLDSLGFERATAGIVTMFIPLVSLTVRIPYGWLADIFHTKYVMATSIGLTSAGLFLFWLLHDSSFGSIIAFVVVFGLGMGGPTTLRTPVVKEYFGTRNFGTIYGLINVFNTIGLMLYPPVAGWVYDTLGVYDPIWLVFGGASMLGVIFMLTLPSSEGGQSSTFS